MSEGRARGHRRGPTARQPQMSGYLRKTLDECNEQADAPVIYRITEGLDVPERDVKALIDALDTSEIITEATRSILELLTQIVDDEDLPDGERKWAHRIRALLAMPATGWDGEGPDEEGQAVMREFLRNVAIFGFLEGWVFGTGAAVNRIQSLEARRRNRPHR